MRYAYYAQEAIHYIIARQNRLYICFYVRR